MSSRFQIAGIVILGWLLSLGLQAQIPSFKSFNQGHFTTNNFTISLRNPGGGGPNGYFVAAGTNVVVVTNGSLVTISTIVSGFITNLVTTNSDAGITNLILSVATNTAVAAGTNVTVTTNVSGNYIIYTISGQPRVTSGLVTNIFSTNASNTQISNDVRNIVGTNAYVAAGTNITIQTNSTTYTVNASVPTVTTNIVSTNSSAGVTNVVLGIVTNAFPQGSGVSNKVAYWQNTNLLGSSVIQQTSTNLVETFNVAASGTDTNGWLTNRIYGYYNSTASFQALEIYGFGNNNQSSNGMVIMERRAGTPSPNTLTFGADGIPWVTLNQIGEFVPVQKTTTGGLGQHLGSSDHAWGRLYVDTIQFQDELGPSLLLANIQGPSGNPSMSWNNGYINWQAGPTTAATMSYGIDGKLYLGSSSALIFNVANNTALGIQFATNGPSARMGFVTFTNGFRDVTNQIALSSKDLVSPTYVSLDGTKSLVAEDQTHRTNGVSFRLVSANNLDTNGANWEIHRIYP